MTQAYYRKTPQQALEAQNASAEGLSAQEARRRAEQYGPNKLSEGKKKSTLQVFLEQFKDLMVLILIIAAVISAFSGNVESTIVIFAVLVLNAILGTVQYEKAEKSLESLKAMASPTAKVMRGGVRVEIPSADVVPGDIVLLEAGDMVRTSYAGPGQFVHVKCGEGLLLRRPISVCSCQEDVPNDFIAIAFEVRGDGTRWLAQRKVGDTLDVMGLLGNGFSIKPKGRYLLVGGGIGIPPMRGCAQATEGRSTAILGGRSKDKIILQSCFNDECAKVLVATDDGSLGHHGFVDALVRQELEQDKNYDGVLACGPKPMLRNVANVAQEFGIPCQVSMEERMGCGVGACLVCACDMADGSRKHVCKDGPVFDSREVNWDV